MLYYPDTSDPEQWLIYFISKPLVGTVETVSTVPKALQDRSRPDAMASPARPSKKKEVKSFNELLMLFPMIARQMQAGLEKMFQEFVISFEEYKPLPLRPQSPMSYRSHRSTASIASSRASIRSRSSLQSTVNGDIYRQSADESEIRKNLEAAINTAIELFQRVDQSQLDLLASTTDLTGHGVDRLIERYVTEQLHEHTLFPRLCATKALEDNELDHKLAEMENVDLTQVGIPSIDQQEKKGLASRIASGIKCFEKIGHAKSPQAMVEHLLETAKTLTQADNGSGEQEGVTGSGEKSNTTVVTMNADMLVSLLLVVVIRSKVQNLHACLSYMRNFVFSEDVEAGEIGYILSTLEAVLFHIAQDHLLGAASRANEKLWQNVRDGNMKAVGVILEVDDRDLTGTDDETTTISSASGKARSFALDGDNLGEEPPEEPATAPSEPTVNGVTTPAINGILKTQGNDDIETPHSQSRQRSLSTGSVQISENPPTNIPSGEVAVEEEEPKPEEGKDEPEDKDKVHPPPSALAKEGPPAEDGVFDIPTSPSTGVANIRIEELQSGINGDADSIRSFKVATSIIPQKTVTSNPRVGIARFDIQDRPNSLKFTRSRNSAVSLASVATVSDASMSSLALSRTVTNQSMSVDVFSVEKLSRTRNRQGDSILTMAIQERKAAMLQYLINTELFSTEFILADVRDDNTTLLSTAVQMEDMASVEILLKVLAKMSDRTIRKYLAVPDVSQRTVAHYLFSTPDLINRLGRWLPWRAKDKNGQTPLFALCRSYDHGRYREMVGMGIKQAQAAQQDHSKLHLDEHADSKGNTLLHIAGEPGVVRSLLRCDSDVNATNEKGFTPLMVASKYGRIEMVRTLFGDPRVNHLAKELRGLTAVELAKDDDVRNRIDGMSLANPLPDSLLSMSDLVLFQNQPADDGRVTAVVRSFFVEDATIRVILKSGAPSTLESSTFTVTTCRRSLTDFQFLAQWLQFENPASWLPSLLVSRSPYQIASKPSRAVLRDIQLRVDNFLRTLLAHPTFSTHELLWEFFLVPEMQQDSLIDRSRKKAEARNDRIREEFLPISDIREVEMFVSFAKDSVRSINYACRSVTRRATVVRTTLSDLPETYRNTHRHLTGFKWLANTPQLAALARFTTTLSPNESHPYTLFLEDLRNILASLTGVTHALDRPKHIIDQMSAIQKQIDRHLISLRRSDRWPLGILDDTRARMHQEAAAKAQARVVEKSQLAQELRYTQSVAAQELAAFHEMHTKQAKQTIRELAKRMVVSEKDRLERMKRALRGMRGEAAAPEGSL